jgi:hypothetical protein
MSNAAAFDRVADTNVGDYGYYLEGEHEYVEHEGYREGDAKGDAEGDAEDDEEDNVAAHFTVQPWLCTGNVRISDPGYPRTLHPDDLSVAGTIRAQPGMWNSCAYTDEGLISGLVAWAAAGPMPEFNSDRWVRIAFDVGVSTGFCGICGFCDDSFFSTGADIGECEDDTSFFGQVVAAVERSHPAFSSVQQGGVAVDCGEGVFEVAVIAGP